MKGRFKQMISSNRWLKMVPNALTLCNSICGFIAILYSLRAYEKGLAEGASTLFFAVSAWLILCAMIFDALDGFAARIFNAASMHGVQMDSLADMVTFGVAPATVVAIMTNSLRGDDTHLLIVYVLCSVYLGCAALRLATYNVHAILNKKSGDKFSGLPSPGAAAAVCSVVLFAEQAEIPLETLATILPIYAALLGLLMVSPIPYTHFAKWLATVRRNPRRLALLILMVAVVVIFGGRGVLVLVTAYVVSGPLAALIGVCRRKPNKPEGVLAQ